MKNQKVDNTTLELNRIAAKRVSARNAAFQALEMHRDTCPVCSKPGMEINVIRDGECVEGQRLANAVVL